MSFISWQTLQAFETFHRQIHDGLASLIDNRQAATIWMNTDGSDLVSTIKIYETNENIMLDIELSEHLTNLEVQVSSETAVIRARSLQDQVEGCFSPGLQENIIPLPIAVHPEAVRAELHDSMLTLVLPQSGKIDRQSIALQLGTRQPSELVPRSMGHLSSMNLPL